MKQKRSFDDVSETLITYLSRLKDLRDQLNHIDYVFKSKEAMSEFISSLKSYSAIYEEFNGNWNNHSNDIVHYWNSTQTQDEYLKVKKIILDDIHRQLILPLNDSVIVPIRNAAVGKSHKPRKIKKETSKALIEIDEKIDILDSALLLFLKTLSDF